MRWHYRDPLLVWLFPAAYALHILEEWFGGFPEWFAIVLGNPLPREAFVLLNALALGAMVLAAGMAVRREQHGWLAVAIATVVLTNGLLHILSSLWTAAYSPGLFTSVVLYLPLGQLALLRAWQQARPSFAGGAAAGLGAHALVVLVARAAARA